MGIVRKSQLKKWAKEHLRGLENCVMPSFTRDLSQLDEDGIRWDVQQSVRHGFVSMLCTCEAGLTFEEAKRFVGLVAGEAKEKIFVCVTVMFDNFKQNFEMLQHADKVGCHCALLGYPPNYYPKSEDEILKVTREMCDSTGLGIVLFPSQIFNFRRFHPSGFPPQLLLQMCDIENVVAMKSSVGVIGAQGQVFHLCGEKVLVNVPLESMTPIFVQKYGQQWIGGSPHEAYQSPEKPYLVEYFNLMLKGEFEKAMEIYWKLHPVRVCFEATKAKYQAGGTKHYPLWKYYQWCVGGNGGFTRQHVMKMDQRDMEAHKSALRAIGITPREPDEEFFIGRVNFSKE
jgi:dihydrodipicolinate synthase/N-acetylneuraminate lyase